MFGYPPLLLLDDPTTGMDAVSVSQTCDLLKRYRNSGGAIVMSSARYVVMVVALTKHIFSQWLWVRSPKPAHLAFLDVTYGELLWLVHTTIL